MRISIWLQFAKLWVIIIYILYLNIRQFDETCERGILCLVPRLKLFTFDVASLNLKPRVEPCLTGEDWVWPHTIRHGFLRQVPFHFHMISSEFRSREKRIRRKKERRWQLHLQFLDSILRSSVALWRFHLSLLSPALPWEINGRRRLLIRPLELILTKTRCAFPSFFFLLCFFVPYFWIILVAIANLPADSGNNSRSC